VVPVLYLANEVANKSGCGEKEWPADVEALFS
jgi:hypothetical protein